MPITELHSSEHLSALQRRIVLLGMMGGTSLAALDQMVLTTAVSEIAGELGDLAQAPWIFTANLLASASSMPIWGKLGDLYGRRRVFQSAIVLFIVASLLAAKADSMIQLLVCRALQGLGGGALLTMPYAIVGDIVSPRDRPAYAAFISVVWTASGFLGPPLGGFLVDGPGWRWMFFINIPTALLSFACLQWGYRIPRRRIEHSVDFVGAALLFCSVGSLILYTSWAGERFGWSAPSALLLLALSSVLAVAFVLQERRAPEPIVELSLLRLRPVWPPLVTTAIFGFANFSIAFFIPLFGIVVRHSTAVEAGFALAPLTAGILISGIVVGRLAAATQRYRRYATTGVIIYVIGLTLLVTADGETPLPLFLFYNLLLGVGSGALSPVLVASLQNAVEERYLGVASSLPGFARAVAQTIGTSILGSFLALRISAHLRQDVAPIAPPSIELNTFIESPTAIRGLAPPLEGAVVEAYRAAFSETFFLMTLIIALSLVASRFMRDPLR
ncbi:MAG: MFS transporter [bacterium]|nr:MFS transporter [bacterium]